MTIMFHYPLKQINTKLLSTHETLVKSRYSRSREKAARHSQFARAWRRSLPFPARGKYSCSVHGARGVRGGRGADTEVDKQGKR